MRPGGHRPPQAGQVHLAPRPPELPDREEQLWPQPRPRSRQPTALNSPRIEKTQLELRIAVPGTPGLPHSARSVPYGHVVSKL